MDLFEKFLLQLSARPDGPVVEQNFFDVGGSGYLENPTSDLMALFMGAQPSAPRWLAKALLLCIVDRGYATELDVNLVAWEEVTAEREVSERDDETETLKRLDLVVCSGQFILGIENKVLASAGANPFRIYENLLSNRSKNRTILRCILRPTARLDDLPPDCDWPVISYGNLVAKAQMLYGQDVAFSQVTKWHFFYVEFLKHLQSLATPNYGGTMSSADLDFVAGHFAELRRAQKLLEKFEGELLREGQAAVARSLSSVDIDTNVKTAAHAWPDGQRALRFRPQNWGGQSDVVLVYFDNSESDAESQIGFYLRAYIRKGSEPEPLDVVERKLDEVTRSASHAWINEEDAKFCWYESNNSWLGFTAYAKEYTREGSLAALGDLAKWLQENVFASRP